MNTTTTLEKKDTDQAVKKADEAAKPRPRRKGRKQEPRSLAPGRQSGSDRARRTAAAILEVLGGVRTPTAAAEALGVSLPRYYVLESRALQGFVDAVEPRPAGPPVRPAKQLERLQKEVEKLHNESARYQALVRATQRTVGLAPPKKARPKKANGRKKRRRKPTVRALKASEGLRKGLPAARTDAAAGEPVAAEAAVTPVAKPV